MTKGELLRFLEPFDDAIEVRIDNGAIQVMDLQYKIDADGEGRVIIETQLG